MLQVGAATPRWRHHRLAARREHLLLRGDLVEFDATPLRRRRLLQRLAADPRQPGRAEPAAGARRGPALMGEAQVRRGLRRAAISDLLAPARWSRRARWTGLRRPCTRLRPETAAVIFDHCMPFDVTRAYDEAKASATRGSGRPSATGRCGKPSKAATRINAHARPTPTPFAHRRPPELDGRSRAAAGGRRRRRPGRAELRDRPAQRGLPVLLLDEDDTVSVGSRGLCYAKRTLEILDRLGVGQPASSTRA